MEEDRLSLYIGLIGNILSILLFLSPIEIFWGIVQRGSTEEYESLPYIITLTGSALWTYYGIIKPGEYLVATVSGFGVIVEAVYVALFLIYAPTTTKGKNAKLVGILGVGLCVMAMLAIQLILQGETRINTVGYMSAALNIIMYASPLAVMGTVVRSKSVEYMPFFFSFFVFVNSGAWTIYGVLFSDYFVGVSNAPGVILGLAQLLLYAIYRNGKKSNTTSFTSVKGLEEGWQHEHLIIDNSGMATFN